MGYVKDNFPGSAAFYLRRKAYGVLVAYVFGVTAVVCLFAPGIKRFKKNRDEGLFDQPQWLIEKNANRHHTGALIHAPLHQRQNTNKIGEEIDSQDFTRRRTWKYSNLQNIFGFQFNSGFVTPPPTSPSLVPTASSEEDGAAGPSSTPPQQNSQ